MARGTRRMRGQLATDTAPGPVGVWVFGGGEGGEGGEDTCQLCGAPTAKRRLPSADCSQVFFQGGVDPHQAGPLPLTTTTAHYRCYSCSSSFRRTRPLSLARTAPPARTAVRRLYPHSLDPVLNLPTGGPDRPARAQHRGPQEEERTPHTHNTHTHTHARARAHTHTHTHRSPTRTGP